MIELIKKAMLTGIGFAALTKEKVEEVAQDFIEQGKMSEQEGKKFVDEVMTKSRQSQEDMVRQVEVYVAQRLEKMHVAREEDIDALRTEIANLKKRIHTLEERQESQG